MTAHDTVKLEPTPHTGGPRKPGSVARRVLHLSGVARFSGLYALAILIIVFSVTLPSLFPTQVTLKLILRDQAITGLLALAALIPLAAGVIDLSFAWVAGFTLVFMSELTLHTSFPVWVCAVAAILVSCLFGLLSGIVITTFHLDSLIVTLAIGTIALGLTELMTGGAVVTPRLGHFSKLGQGFLGILPIPTLVLLVIAGGEFVWLEHTTSGRRMLASGDNAIASVLAGIRVARTQCVALVVSSCIAGLAGVVLVSEVGSATNTTASAFLLPAIAALFLGSTQVLPRVNVIGTIIAVYVLGVGIKGLQLHGAQPWVQDFFNGAVLLIAIIIAARGAQKRQ